MSKPTFFCVGAMKAGTHLWYNLITQSKDIAKLPKEQKYFNRLDISKEEYELKFDTKEKYKHRGETTPSYLSKDIANKIYKEYPNAYIIIILRDPVDRLISHYKMREYIYNIQTPLEEYIKEQEYLVENSLYYEAIYEYKRLFKDKVQILLFEDLIKDTEKVMNTSFDFLGVEKPKLNLNVDINECRKNSKVLGLIKGFVYKVFGYKNSQVLNDIINYKLLNLFMKLGLVKKNNYSLKAYKKKRLYNKYFKEDINKAIVLLKVKLPYGKYKDR